MKNIHQCLRFFVAQSGPNDCGLAGLAMILNFGGKRAEAGKLMKQTVNSQEGLSLLEIRLLAQSAGLVGRVVRMDVGNLREVGSPCILHVSKAELGDHFVVCFGARRKKDFYQYLIADPAIGVQCMNESDLVQIWKSNAAIYFQGLRCDFLSKYRPLWIQLLRIKSFRRVVLLAVPLLNLCSTMLGIGLSWMLQRGFEHPFADQQISLLSELLVLLLIIMLFKNIINYLRRRLLILLSSSVGEHLNKAYIESLLFLQPGDSRHDAECIKNTLVEIRKIQHATATFVSVIASEGLIMTLIITALLFYDPLMGCINIVYCLFSFAIAIRMVPRTIFESVKFQQLSGKYESRIIADISGDMSATTITEIIERHFKKLKQFTESAKYVASRASKESLLYDCAGTVNVIAVFSVGIYQLRLHELIYNDLIVGMILSYFLVTLIPRVCYALAIVTDGALPVARFLDE